MKSELITRAMHTRGALVLAIIIALTSALAAYASSGWGLPFSVQGFVSGWGLDCGDVPVLGVCVESALFVCIILLLTHLNKAYNLMRAMSMLHCTFFLVICAATPSILLRLCPGTILCAVVLLCIAILYFVCISGSLDMRKVFLVFAILSGCTAFDAAFVIYVPTMLIACMQLHIFSLRTFSAFLMGIVTPWVIYLGFGIVSPSDLQLPVWDFRLPDFRDPRTQVLLSTVGLTIFISAISLLRNLVKIISYNARSRSLLSVITLNTIVTMVAALIDFDDVSSYITILNMFAAFQMAHMFVAIHNSRRSYIGILCIIMVYLGILVWRCLV